MTPIPGWEGRYSITKTGRIWSHCSGKYRRTTLRKGYPCVNLKRNSVQFGFGVHKLLGLTFLGLKEGEQLEHKDGIPANTRLSNLRISSQSQNRGNARGWKKKKSGSRFKGVFPYGNKWKAQLGIGGKTTYLGVFIKQSCAAKAYDRAALFAYGEFARPNFKIAPIDLTV